MITPLFIFVLGLTPSILSLWLLRRAEAKAQARLRLAMQSSANRGLPHQQDTDQGDRNQSETERPYADRHYVEGLGYVRGDISCEFNARSSYIRCAINPTGPCEGCRFYQACP